MATRTSTRQSEHDNALRAAASIYIDKGRIVWTNPDGEKNKAWAGRYIDVVAARSTTEEKAWVVEIETADSVSENEAKSQWVDYDSAYQAWHLAVPVGSKSDAENLLAKYRIQHCSVVTWRRNADGTHTFWGLPGTL